MADKELFSKVNEISKQMNKLPDVFKKYFWDCDFTLLDFNKNKEFILKRLLNFGDIDVIKFLLDEVSKQEVSDLLSKKGQTVLTNTNYLFWQKLIKYDELWR